MIKFDAENHLYFDDKGFIVPSVTEILGVVYGTGLENAPKHFVERAAEKGHAIHAEIEKYIKTGEKGQTPEFQAWLKVFANTVPVYVGDSEKIIFANTPSGAFAGTVDLLGNGFLYDWKTCKTATRQQIAKWQKQLSFYCYALRQMRNIVNEPLKVVHLTDICDVINVPYLGDDFVEDTMAKYKDIVAGKAVQQVKPAPVQELQTVSQKDLQILEDTLMQIDTLNKVVDDFKERIKAEMSERGILNLKIGNVTMTYVSGTTRQTFDAKAFRNDDPDLYALYLKSTEVKPSLRITVK